MPGLGRRSVLLALFGLALCAAPACGGSSAGAGGSSGGVAGSSGGVAGSSGATGSGGAAGSAGSGQCDPAKWFQCVPALCSGDLLFAADCSHGEWKCVEQGWVPIDQCPSDACFNTPVYLCCDSAGGGIPPTCPGHGSPVCPSDRFLATTTGTGCPAAGQFPCGSSSCTLGKEYCRWTAGQGACQPLPAACGSTPDCACLAGESCSCTDFGIGALSCNAN